jgi:hypothetical protein
MWTGCVEEAKKGLMSRLGDGSRFIDAVWIVEATPMGKEVGILLFVEMRS